MPKHVKPLTVAEVGGAKLKPGGESNTYSDGNAASLTGRDWMVPKVLVVGELRMLLHRKLLQVAGGLEERETLAEELAAFTARLSASGRASFEGKGGEHDDSVIPLSIGCYAAMNRPKPIRVIEGGLIGWANSARYNGRGI